MARERPYLPTPLVVAALSIAVLGCCTGMSTPLMHLVPLIEGCGFDATQASGVLLTLMIAAIGGRIAFGKLADMFGALPACFSAVAWQTALIFFFTQINDLTTFAIFAPIYGFGYGGVMTGLLISVRELTPPLRRASATGIVLSFAWAGHGLGGWQGGATYDASGGYIWGFGNAVLAGSVTLAILAMLMFFGRRPQTPDVLVN
jgi:predicted MFS family arabinose efflux permease